MNAIRMFGAAAAVVALSCGSANADPLPYGPDTCKAGYVWRDAAPSDHVCVTPEDRQIAADENAQAASHRSPIGGGYGPNTCLSGYVWREAFGGDVVCVTPDQRSAAAQQNAQGLSHRVLAYGPDTCREGFVWRDAAPSDHVCVAPGSRSVAANENALAASRQTKPGRQVFGP